MNTPTGGFYNSLAVSSIGSTTRLGRGWWGLDYTPSINLKLNVDNSVTYTGPGGLSGVFGLKTEYTYTRAAGSTPSRSPATPPPPTSTTTPTVPLAFNAENQITTTGYTYDGAGNLTVKPGITTIGYNDGDQLTSVTKSGVTYDYTYAGIDNNELIRQETSGDDYFYAYGRDSAQGVPTVEMVHKGSGTADVVNDPKTGQPLMLRTSAGTQSMYITDGVNGSPLALLTSGGSTAVATEYDPYGLPTVTTGSSSLDDQENPYTFAGGIQDRVTGWVHYGARYYDPITGTWTQRDTLDTPLDLANANRYAYAGGDPISNIDPTGSVSWQDGVGNVFGAGVGLLVAIPVSAIATPAAGAVAGRIIGAVAAGCVSGALSTGYTNALNNKGTSVGELGSSCGFGAVSGGLAG